jgi:hypothetical protein
MSAASPAPLPLYKEGLVFYEELANESRSLMDAINAAALDSGLASEHLVEWVPGRGIGMIRKEFPSTEIRSILAFEHWGPVMKVSIRGHQEEDLPFYPEDLEIPLGVDLDDNVVAIFGEGRSLTPHELACYLAQSLRRCFPEMVLPCTSCGQA